MQRRLSCSFTLIGQLPQPNSKTGNNREQQGTDREPVVPCFFRKKLTDTTGNRRWLPFRVKSIQDPFLNPVQPYSFYYAQALYMIEHGFAYWFDQTQIQHLSAHVETFHKETSEEQLLPVYYEPATKDTPNAVFRTAAEISARLSFLGNIRQPMELRQLGKLLSCHSFTPLKTTGGKRGYFVVEHTNNQQDVKDIINELENS